MARKENEIIGDTGPYAVYYPPGFLPRCLSQYPRTTWSRYQGGSMCYGIRYVLDQDLVILRDIQ